MNVKGEWGNGLVLGLQIQHGDGIVEKTVPEPLVWNLRLPDGRRAKSPWLECEGFLLCPDLFITEPMKGHSRGFIFE